MSFEFYLSFGLLWHVYLLQFKLLAWPEICIWLAVTALKIMNYGGDGTFNSFSVKCWYELYLYILLLSNFGASMIQRPELLMV